MLQNCCGFSLISGSKNSTKTGANIRCFCNLIHDLFEKAAAAAANGTNLIILEYERYSQAEMPLACDAKFLFPFVLDNPCQGAEPRCSFSLFWRIARVSRTWNPWFGVLDFGRNIAKHMRTCAIVLWHGKKSFAAWIVGTDQKNFHWSINLSIFFKMMIFFFANSNPEAWTTRVVALH